MKKRGRGRPRKKEGSIELWQLGRAAIVMCAYEEAREQGRKHEHAVRYAVICAKRCSPEIRISKGAVRRILSKYSPRKSGTILRFERSTFSEEDINENRWIRKQVLEFQKKMRKILLMPPSYDGTRAVAKFIIRAAERPNYPRANRKAPNN